MNDRPHIDLVQQYFDRHAQEWHDYYQEVDDIVDLILIDRKNIAVNFLAERLEPGARILDAGCGAGITAIELAQRGFTVEGVDISPNMIEIARKNLANSDLPDGKCRFRTGNMLAEPAPEKRYDCVIALGFIQYQPDEAAALAGLSARLRPDGMLVVSGPMRIKISSYFGLAPLLRRVKSRPAGRPDLLHTISANDYSVGRFKELLTGAGFQMIEYDGHGYIHFEFLSHRLSFKAQVRLHNFFTSAARFLPIQRFANDIVIIARKR